MWYWTVNTGMRPPLSSPRPYHGLHLLYTPQSEGNISIKTQPTTHGKDSRLGNLLIRSSLILGGVWRREGGVSWQNKNGGESEQKAPLFPPRPFSPWPPHQWWWWFCSNYRNTINRKMEIHLTSDGNKRRDIKMHSSSETFCPWTLFRNNGDYDPTRKIQFAKW